MRKHAIPVNRLGPGVYQTLDGRYNIERLAAVWHVWDNEIVDYPERRQHQYGTYHAAREALDIVVKAQAARVSL